MANIEWLYNPDKGLPKPDLTLFLTLSMEEIKARADFGNERYENFDFQQIVKSNFLDLLDPLKDQSIKILDVNNKNIPQVSEDIWQVVQSNKMDQLTTNPIQFFD